MTAKERSVPGETAKSNSPGRPAIRAQDDAIAAIAVRFAVEAQALYARLPAARAAAKAYRRAEGAADELKDEVERLRLTPAFPLGTTCDLCRDLAFSA